MEQGKGEPLSLARWTARYYCLERETVDCRLHLGHHRENRMVVSLQRSLARKKEGEYSFLISKLGSNKLKSSGT
jgi:hypothetical protein